MDYERFIGRPIVDKELHPIYASWNGKTVRKIVKIHKRSSRRSYRQYLKTGNMIDYNRSQKRISRHDFD
jgi:hypothetical protein